MWNQYKSYWDQHWFDVGPLTFVTDMDGATYTSYLNELFSHLQKREVKSVIDLGCGNGLLVPTVKTLWPGATYTGYDICTEAVDFASAKYPEYDWVVMSEPILQGKADLIIVTSVFTHISQEDTEHYLDVIREALNPGGRAVVSIHIDCARGVIGTINRVNYEPAYFEALLAKHGFKILGTTNRRQLHYEVEPC